jgi:hypothetical protein
VWPFRWFFRKVTVDRLRVQFVQYANVIVGAV